MKLYSKIIVDVPFGPLAIIWKKIARKGPRIIHILLTRPDLDAVQRAKSLYPTAQVGACPEIDETAAKIMEFMQGKPVDFSLDITDIDSCSPFQQRVLRTEYAIPRGSVSTYGLIADHIGMHGAARAVGNALAGNPFPLIVPCHRAVRSDGSLGGFQGGLEMKRTLLQKEGLQFKSATRLDAVQFLQKLVRFNQSL